MPRRLPPALCLVLTLAPTGRADELTVEQLTERGKRSLVVITSAGRDGRRTNQGTGFVVAADGLVATNLHVIGEARPIGVETPDGKQLEVVAVHATDRSSDLAVLRVKAAGLTPLELGDPTALKDGQSVVALGNPQGLRFSVVSGVVSGRREIEGRPMIQLAIPLEPGNSGGPLLDRRGRVHGVLTMKSAVTANLGFAMPVSALKPLLEKPNPVPIERWLTIGALDPGEWQPLFGANWRQRAGRILVDGTGTGFGGRSLCLSRREPPGMPYEVAVSVRLGDEAGAAGLVFHADGSDKHYGFYPTGGQLRLTRFDGPDVFSWKILWTGPSEHYRPGDWNALKVRVERGRLRCFVNDRLVVESDDNGLTSGRVGLAKFRETQAEFKGFQFGKEVRSPLPPPELAGRVAKAVEGMPPFDAPPSGLVGDLAKAGPLAPAALRERARRLEEQAFAARRLASEVHSQRVRAELVKALAGKDDATDLVHAALLVAHLDNDELDVEAYRREVDRLAQQLAGKIPKDAGDKEKLAALNKFLFEDRGFHGSRGEYYHRSNSYLNEVIDDREGLPITLSVLYIEISRRVGLKLSGVGLPGHFVVRFIPAAGEPVLIDVFEGGKEMSRAEANKRVEALAERPARDDDFAPVTRRQIVVRVLTNLLSLARNERDPDGMLRYLDAIVDLTPEPGRERWMRAVVASQTGRPERARADVD